MTPTGTEQVKQLNLQQQRQQQLQLLQQQLLLQQLNPTIVLSWPTVDPAVADRSALDEVDDGLRAAWPPRSYPCAFCRREFRSAQALGGHMNVHRRDRARMRGHVNGAAQTQGASPHEAPRAVAAAKEFALLYPVLNSNTTSAVFVPGGDLAHLATPVAMAGHGQCHVSGEDKEIDLELRLGWS